MNNNRSIGKVKRVIDEKEGLYEITLTDPATIAYFLKLQMEDKLPAKLTDSDFSEKDV